MPPFGLRSAPKLFYWMAVFLALKLQQQRVTRCCIITLLLHYLDDFLIVTPSVSSACQHNLDIAKQTCQILGVPLTWEKVEGPTTATIFLGIVLYASSMETRLPEEKFKRLQSTVAGWMGKKMTTKQEILSLVGQFQRVAKVVRAGKTFVACMYSLVTKLKKAKFSHKVKGIILIRLVLVAFLFNSWNGSAYYVG